MIRRTLAIGGVAIVVLALVAYAAFEAGVDRGRTNASSSATPAHATHGAAPSTEKRVLYWHDPMAPGTKFDKPGRSPFMEMDLVPVYADDAPQSGGVAIDPRLQQNLGVRTAKAVVGSLLNAISAVGNVVYNERDVVVVQARSSGFVEKLVIASTASFEAVSRS